MKNRPFIYRIGYALQGFREGWRRGTSFRIQLVAATGATLLLTLFQARPIWWATLAITVAGVLGAELFNTALEETLDLLHPEIDPRIARAKDCAAAAVLVLSLASLVVLGAFLWEVFGLYVTVQP